MIIPVVERKFLKKSLKSDYIKTELDLTLEKVTSSVGDIKEVATELIQKVDDKLVEVDTTLVNINEKVDSAIYDLQNIEIPQGEKGDKGEDGVSPDVQAITLDVISRIPKVDEAKLVSTLLKAIPENKPSLKVIQESIDQEKLIEEITPKLKLKVGNIDGLDKTLKALDKRYIHGGGDTVTAGNNVTITRNNNGDKVINANASGSSFTWNVVSTTSQNALVNNGYISNNVALVTITLPVTATIGDVVRVTGKETGGWRVAQNSGQKITWDAGGVDGTDQTTTGVTGYLESTDQYDSIELICLTTDSGWGVLSSKGNINLA